MFHYIAFGLHILSEIRIDDFQKIDNSLTCDAVYKYGGIDLPESIKPECVRTIITHNKGILLYWREIGAFLIEQGYTVTIQPTTTPHRNGLIKSVLMGAVLGVLMFQKNSHLVYHSSVVGRSDGFGAIAFMAKKGGGKSTMATAMMSHSYSLVSDDLLAVPVDDMNVLVEPGFPGMKLWADSAEKFVGNAAELPMLGENVKFEKRVLSLRDNFLNDRLWLNSVFILEYGEDEQPRIEPMDKREALFYLLPHWYGAMFNGQMLPVLGKKRLMDECAFLAGTGRVFRLVRPQSLEKVPLSVELIDEFRKNRSNEAQAV